MTKGYIIPGAAVSALIVASCVSPRSAGQVAAGNWIASVSHVENSAECTIGGPLDLSSSSSGEAISAVLAPFIVELGASLIGAAGAAITDAGKEESQFTQSSPAAAKLADYIEGKPGPQAGLVLPEASLLSVCVRTITAEFRPDAGPDAAPAAPQDDELEFSSLENAKASAERAMQERIPWDIQDVYFYSEILLSPLSPDAGTTDYAVAPVVTWYNKPTKVRSGRLVSMQLAFTRPAAGEKPETALEFVQLFEPAGLAPGTLVSQQSTPPSYTVVPAAPFAAGSKQSFDAILKTASSVLELPLAEGSFSDAGTYLSAVKREQALGRSEGLAACLSASEGKPAKVDACEATEMRKEHQETALADERLKAGIAAVRQSTRKLVGSAGQFNVSVKINESRRANRYFTAIGGALTNAAAAAKDPFKSYVGGQLGVTPDAAPKSTVEAENKLRSARFEYAAAKSRYDSALAAGETSKLEELLRVAIAKYGELRIAYEAVGQPTPEPAPY